MLGELLEVVVLQDLGGADQVGQVGGVQSVQTGLAVQRQAHLLVQLHRLRTATETERTIM